MLLLEKKISDWKKISKRRGEKIFLLTRVMYHLIVMRRILHLQRKTTKNLATKMKRMKRRRKRRTMTRSISRCLRLLPENHTSFGMVRKLGLSNSSGQALGF